MFPSAPIVPLEVSYVVTDGNGYSNMYTSFADALNAAGTIVQGGGRATIRTEMYIQGTMPSGWNIVFEDLGRGAGVGPSVGLNGG